jgi:hypothetical protein
MPTITIYPPVLALDSLLITRSEKIVNVIKINRAISSDAS